MAGARGFHAPAVRTRSFAGFSLLIVRRDVVGSRSGCDEGIILRTIDGGATWVSRRLEWSNGLSAVHFVDADTGVVVGKERSFGRRTGADLVGCEQRTTRQLSGFFVIDAATAVAVGELGTIIRTTDGGENWMRQWVGSGAWLSSVWFSSAKIGTAVGGNGTILRTTDGGMSWTSQTGITDVSLQDVHFSDPLTGTIVGDRRTILRTADGGATWTIQSTGRTGH